eukprot:scaffold6857_cov16-Tisochrysis_lutea.AAC.1
MSGECRQKMTNVQDMTWVTLAYRKERKTTLAKPGLHSGKSFKLIPYKRQACPFELDHRPFPGLHPICSVQTQAQLMEANLSP